MDIKWRLLEPARDWDNSAMRRSRIVEIEAGTLYDVVAEIERLRASRPHLKVVK